MPPRRRPDSGRWEIRWRDGTGARRSKSFARKVDATVFEREVLEDLRRGEYVPLSAMRQTLSSWVAEWLPSTHSLAPKTVGTYQHSLDHVCAVLGAVPLGALQGTDIDRYTAGRLREGVAASSVHREFRTLRTCLLAAVRAGRLHRSPHYQASAPSIPDGDMHILTPDELTRFTDAFDSRYQSWLLACVLGGLRWGEARGLQVRNLNLKAGAVQIVRQIDDQDKAREPKWASRRTVNLPDHAAEALARQVDGKHPDDLVWEMPKGGVLQRNNFVGTAGWWGVYNVDGVLVARYAGPAHDEAKAHAASVGGKAKRGRHQRGQFKLAAAQADLPASLSPHHLRHTAAAFAIAGGVHPKDLQEWMGHKNYSTTMDRYGHLYEGSGTRVAAGIASVWTPG